MGKRKKIPGRLCHKKPPDMAPQSNDAQVFQSDSVLDSYEEQEF